MRPIAIAGLVLLAAAGIIAGAAVAAPAPASPPAPPAVPGTTAPPAAAPPASAPTTRNVTSISDMEPLLDGSIRYVPPPASSGWKLVSKSDDNLKAAYETA